MECPPPKSQQVPSPIGFPALLDAPFEPTANRKSCNEFEARRQIEKIAFFREFENVMPGLVDALAKVAKIQHASKEEIIFRQGDPSVDCYTIMRGAVRTYIKHEPQRSPRTLQNRKAIYRKPLDHSTSTLLDTQPSRCQWNPCSCCRRKSTSFEPKRYLTAEGYNTYSKYSDLGTKRVDLGPNDIFGELGLMNDQPRSGSIQCLEPCKFLVIQKSDFNEMFASRLKNHANTKYSYFHDHVPGFQSWATENLVTSHEDASGKIVFSRDKHPADAFEETTVFRGSRFLMEGSVAEPTIIVIKSGEVAFQRNTIMLPRKVSQAKHDCLAFQTKQPHQKWDRENQVWHVLGPTQLFCSLQLFGLPCSEPFSAEVISEECYVFRASGEGIQRLPRQILNAIKSHTLNTMRPLLWRSPAFVSCFSMPRKLQEYDDEIA